jgi:superfamily II DNA or RNA helicase
MIKSRDWQKRALNSWISQDYKGVVDVVTGAGKTVYACLCDAHLRSLRLIDQTIILVPSEPLLNQWAAGLQSILDVEQKQISLGGGGNKIHFDKQYLLLISKSGNQLATLPAKHNRLLVVDEVHHIASPSLRHLVNIQADFKLGLSATPDRSYDQWMTEYVYPALGNKCFTYSLQDGLRDEILVPFRLTLVQVMPSAEEASALQRSTVAIASAMQANDPTRLKQLLIRHARISNSVSVRTLIVPQLVKHLGLQRGIIFAGDIAQTESIARSLRDHGILAASYHSQLDRQDRQLRIRLYYLGQVNVLVTCAALDEGFDVPSTEFALMVASTASERRRIQRMGRALRPAKSKTAAQIICLFVTNAEQKALQADAERLNVPTTWLKVEGSE